MCQPNLKLDNLHSPTNGYNYIQSTVVFLFLFHLIYHDIYIKTLVMVDDKEKLKTLIISWRICKISLACLCSLVVGWRFAAIGRTADNSATISSCLCILKKKKSSNFSCPPVSDSWVRVCWYICVTPGTFCHEQLGWISPTGGMLSPR